MGTEEEVYSALQMLYWITEHIPYASHAYRVKSGIACGEETSRRSCHHRLLGASFPPAQSSPHRACVWCGIPLEQTHHMFVCWYSMEPEGGHNGSLLLNCVEGFQRFNSLPRGDKQRGALMLLA